MTKAISLLMLVGLAAGLSDQEMRAVVEQALDQPTTLTIDNAPLNEAFAKISETTGLSLTIGPDALAYLPYGEHTRVSARLENVRLREGIEAMCSRIGMTYLIAGSGVEIVPSPPLVRLGRAATWDELATIAALMQARWSGDKNDLASWRDRVRFEGLRGSFDDNWAALTQQVAAAGTGRGDEVLSRACAAMDATWYPRGENIVVLTLREQLLHELQRPVSVRCSNRPLADAIRNLSRQAGVPIRIDPASAAQLSERVKQSFSLLAEGVTVEEALDQIAIATGLAYEVSGDTVLLRSPEQTAGDQSTGRGPRGSDPIVGKVVVPSTDSRYSFEWFIRASDLSAAENARREKLIKEAVEQMKRDLPQAD